MKIVPVLHNIRSIYNVGAILRTCDGLGITEVVLSGYTPKYDDPAALPHVRAKLNHQIEKSALGAERSVRQEIVANLSQWLTERKDAGAIIVGLENNLRENERARKIVLGQATNYMIRPREATTAPQDHDLILILGEEVHGIPDEVRDLCDYFLEIPMHGQKESFNVSIAAAIALWELGKHPENCKKNGN